MVQLIPLDQTTAGKQIYERGFNLGKLIGPIRLAQQLLKQPLSTKEELAKRTEEELKAILAQLEAQLEASLKLQ